MRKAEFEEGNKDVFTTAVHKALIVTRPLLSRHMPEMTEVVFGSWQSQEVKHLKERVLFKTAEIDNGAEELIRKNMIFFPNELFLRASPFHIDNWTRDSFYTCMALNEPETEIHILGRFTKSDYRYPQIPTTKLLFTNRSWFFDDESTALGLIWRGKLSEMGATLDTNEKVAWQHRLDWLREHVEDGTYVTPKGTERSWFDTFDFPTPDVLTYNQGIYVASLVAADRMGFQLSYGELTAALCVYEGLTYPSSSRLRFSKAFLYKDVSSLVGEFLANRLFDVSLLPSEVVRSRVETLDPGGGGYKVVSKEDGSFLDPSEFNRHYKAGDYHNGANWPLFSTIARATGERHGLPFDPDFWHRSKNFLITTKNAEYDRTDENDLKPSWNHTRENHAWNALAHVLIKEALEKPKLERVGFMHQNDHDQK